MLFDLPRKQKISVNNNIFKNLWGWRNADNLGHEFWGRSFRGPETLEKQGRKKNRGTKTAEEFAEKFAGNFLKIRQTKIKIN